MHPETLNSSADIKSTGPKKNESTSTPVVSSSPLRPPARSNRGFALMNKERQRQIASMGGKAVRPESRSFSINHELAKEAGRKGGLSVPPEKRSFSQDRQLASKSGVKGGKSVNPANRSFSLNPGLARLAGRKGGLSSQKGRS